MGMLIYMGMAVRAVGGRRGRGGGTLQGRDVEGR